MMKCNRRTRWAVILVLALAMGCLPDQTWVKAEKSSASAEKTFASAEEMSPLTEPQPDYGLQNPRTDEEGVTTWDCIWFGNYWQEDTNGDKLANQKDKKTPIKWRVLSVNGDDVFLLADENLDCRKHYADTWEKSAMRTWLNNTFFNQAFNVFEQEAVKVTSVVNDDNPDYKTEGGNDTTDRVYLLSIDEVRNPAYGFIPTDDSTKTREAKNTAYTKTQGAWSEATTGTGSWWLRSPGITMGKNSYVFLLGNVFHRDWEGGIDGDVVRPALHLDLSAVSVWSKAGTVCSTGEVSETSPSPKPDHGLSNPSTNGEVTTWDCIWFGNYWQEDTNGNGVADQTDEKTPIKWRVLAVDGDEAILLADKNLDCKKYNDTDANVTWETCTMRTWLNDTFFNEAFSTPEQETVKATTANGEKPKYGTETGNTTTDKVYLLSIGEAMEPLFGFSSTADGAKTREAKNTAYAGTKGAWANTDGEYAGNGFWWLRSPGSYNADASIVDYIGDVGRYGHDVNHNSNGVRPALRLDLSSVSVWSKAGTVSSLGEAPPVSSASPKPNYGLSKPSTKGKVTTWDCIWFGNYWQEDTNGNGVADRNDEKTPIKWRVLSVDGNDAFLLSDQSLDCQKYHDTYTDVTWETCTMRTWMNNTFFNQAFRTSEQEAVRITTVVNNDNPKYGTESGNTTMDKVYLLSIGEVMTPLYGFTSTNTATKIREAKNTAYAGKQGAFTNTSKEYAGNGVWWLRSPGGYGFYAAVAGYDGNVSQNGMDATNNQAAMRPALHLNLASTSVWSKAGTVSSEGEISEILPISTATPSPTPVATALPTISPIVSGTPTETPTIPPVTTVSPSSTPPVAVTPTPTATALPTISPIVSGTPTKTPTIPPVTTVSPLPTLVAPVTSTPAETALPTISPISSGTPTETPTIPPALTEPPFPPPSVVITLPPAVTASPTSPPVPAASGTEAAPSKTPVPTKSPVPDSGLSTIVDELGVSEDTAAKIQTVAKELDVSMDTILVTEQMIQSQKTDDDIKGSYFARIQARASQITQKNIKLSWNRVKGADGYEVYGNRCNTKKWIYEYKKMKTIQNGNKKSFIDRNCKKGTYHKYIVRAYKIIDGRKVTIAASKTIHVTTAGGKNGNAKSVKVNKKKVSLKAGKSIKLKSSEIKESKPLRHHREVSYESSAPDVATVSEKGRIKAKKRGKCIIFAYAQSGIFRKIKVTVK